MKVGCVICSDSFLSFANVSAIPCGHTFHTHCLLQWIENSRSCPSCRQKATTKSVIKLFFDSSTAEDVEVDKDALQNQIDNLKFQVVEKSQILINIKEEKAQFEKQCAALRDEVRKLEADIKKKNTTIAAYKEQLNHLDAVVKNASRAEEEARNTKAELKLLRQVKQLVESNSEEIEETIVSSTIGSESIRNLATISTVLKSRLKKVLEEKRRVGDESHNLHLQLKEAKKDLKNTKDRMVEIEKEFSMQTEDIKALERENRSLLKKVLSLQKAIDSPSGDVRNSVIHRLISESPAPSHLKRNIQETQTVDLTPEITRKTPRIFPTQELEVFQNENGQPPQLKLESASLVNFPTLLKKNGAALSNVHMRSSQTHTNRDTPFLASKGGYDGLGGHHQVDFFPQPKFATSGLPTRTKSLTSKVRGPTQVSSKSIKDFFKDPFA